MRKAKNGRSQQLAVLADVKDIAFDQRSQPALRCNVDNLASTIGIALGSEWEQLLVWVRLTLLNEEIGRGDLPEWDRLSLACFVDLTASEYASQPPSAVAKMISGFKDYSSSDPFVVFSKATRSPVLPCYYVQGVIMYTIRLFLCCCFSIFHPRLPKILRRPNPLLIP